jgi:hypothetical protein
MEAAPGVTRIEESETGVPELGPPELPAPPQAFRSRIDATMQISAGSNRRFFTVFSVGALALVFVLVAGERLRI